MPKLKPKKPKKHKPKKPKKNVKHPHHGKPNPENPKHKPGKKPQKPIKKHPRPPRSGSMPRACRKLDGLSAQLDCWLKHNPKIANAIIWQPAPGVAQTSTIAWPDWTSAMKSDLRQAWMAARAWHDGGMTTFTGTFVADPPPNQDFIPNGVQLRTVFDEATQAWPLFLAIVAHSLAAEIDAWVPWSLRGYTTESLEHMLSGARMFRRDSDDGGVNDSDHPGGYLLGGSDSMEICTPSHPTFTYPFLLANSLVDGTALGTIARAIDWCRWNLTHFSGTLGVQNAENHWQYRGHPPVRRIIEGTPYLDPQNPVVPLPRHWTAGCVGTSAFLRSLLRAVNIPVILRWRGTHTLPWFPGAGRSLSHGDDPYNAYAKADYPAELLLIGEATFASWFPFDPDDPGNPANHATSVAHIGQRVADLAVSHIGDAMVFTYCQDKASGLGHAGGKVFEYFGSHGYTVAQLEATELWERLEAEAQLQGAC